MLNNYLHNKINKIKLYKKGPPINTQLTGRLSYNEEINYI